MSEKILVGFDASDSAKRALDFAVAEAKAHDGEIVLVHVLEWSPYSFLTPEEIEERHKRRKEELDRAETAIIAPVLAELGKQGVKVSSELKYGHIAETLCKVAKDTGAAHVVIGRTDHSELASRLFGSVTGSMAQASPVPITIIP